MKPLHILGISAYYHDSAACLVRDGEIVAKVTILAELQFPHSRRLLYSAFTNYTGFKVNSGE